MYPVYSVACVHSIWENPIICTTFRKMLHSPLRNYV